jgi:uncharacterized Fe-S cluster-containing radical SAM superfamily protein
VSRLISPKERGEFLKGVVVKGRRRKYYRVVRADRWYGGIATADCVGCNLSCLFCWSDKPRNHPEKIGQFYDPEEIAEELIACAQRKGYKQLRISGNEPTIAKEHLLLLLEKIEGRGFIFILETNGTLIDEEYAKDLRSFRSLRVRVSLKGTNPKEFSLLTGAEEEGFLMQINALFNLVRNKVRSHPAVMLSFSPPENFEKLKILLGKIDRQLVEQLEEEYIFLYPPVKKRLEAKGLKPIVAYSPNRIPAGLV